MRYIVAECVAKLIATQPEGIIRTSQIFVFEYVVGTGLYKYMFVCLFVSINTDDK